jgi:hypothetical protein
LSFFLIVPEMGVGYLFFELLQLGSFSFRVKETSAIRPRGVLNLHSVRAIPVRPVYRASTIFLLFKRVGAEALHAFISTPILSQESNIAYHS